MTTELFQNRASNALGKLHAVSSYSVTPSSVKTQDFQELQLVVAGREGGRRVEQTNCFGHKPGWKMINRDDKPGASTILSIIIEQTNCFGA